MKSEVNCWPVDRASDPMIGPARSYTIKLVGTRAFSSAARSTGFKLRILLSRQIFSVVGVYLRHLQLSHYVFVVKSFITRVAT